MARRVLICGDRDWKDDAMIDRFVMALPAGTLVIHGECQGADVAAKWSALRRGLPTVGMPAAWQCLGSRAGPTRNQWMLDYLTPTEVHAFHDNIAASRGTKDMLDRAKRRGLKPELHTHAESELFAG